MSTETLPLKQPGNAPEIPASSGSAKFGSLDKRTAQEEIKKSKAANKLATYFNKILEQYFENPTDIKLALKEVPDLQVNIAHVLKNHKLNDAQKAQLIAKFINERLGVEVAVLKPRDASRVQGTHPIPEEHKQETDPDVEIHQSKYAGSLPYLAHTSRFEVNYPLQRLSLREEKPGSLFKIAQESGIA
ncbi:MAG: hypothetical protein GYA55_01835 [SAR324 cluster bacterium]|uniref:Uncharacterized protein n=1 Tax=SAR324 cluster bacterium TaxID=2024889 RepID=A0A7X9IJB7_9DELT|nr:hypothetical protein [SAR324 cluster bacterium]